MLPPSVAITAEVHVEAFAVTEGASAPQVGSPMINTVYAAKSDALIASQAFPLTTVTVRPRLVAVVSSTLGLPVTVSALINAVPDAAAAGVARLVASAASPALLNVVIANAITTSLLVGCVRYLTGRERVTFSPSGRGKEDRAADTARFGADHLANWRASPPERPGPNKQVHWQRGSRDLRVRALRIGGRAAAGSGHSHVGELNHLAVIIVDRVSSSCQ